MNHSNRGSSSIVQESTGHISDNWARSKVCIGLQSFASFLEMARLSAMHLDRDYGFTHSCWRFLGVSVVGSSVRVFLFLCKQSQNPRHYNLCIMLIPPLCIIFCFLVEEEFIYNVVLVSSIKQSDSLICMCICIYILFHTFPLKVITMLSLEGAWVQSLVGEMILHAAWLSQNT